MMNFKVKRAAVLLTAIALLLAAAVGGTVAFLVASTGEVVNTFTPTSITTDIDEDFDGKTKSNVFLTNTGNIPAYIRAKVVFTWKDEAGNVHSHKPVRDVDYTIDWGTSEWDQGSDGFWYYTQPVLPLPEGANAKEATAPVGVTSHLIESCTDKDTAPDGYNLHVEILAQAIQATPASVVEQAWGVKVGAKGIISKS